ncbi:MAG: chorismate mutase [Sphaerochaetaceae bacterium]|nr:chorismate mutase [Sphaerochaetaceae bacterium]
MIKSLRGAIFLKENSITEIDDKAVKLYLGLLEQNNIKEEDIISLIITHTLDLTKRNSATSLRKAGLAKNICLMCVQEANIENSAPMVVRMLLTFNTKSSKLNPVYLNGAEKLRPDLNQK